MTSIPKLNTNQTEYIEHNKNKNTKYSLIKDTETKSKSNSFILCIEKIISFSSKVFASAPFAFKYGAYKIASLFGRVDKKTLQKIGFSLTAPWRANDYEKIDYKNYLSNSNNYGEIYLGALPVHNRGMFNNLTVGEQSPLKEGDVVVSLNEDWERGEMANSKPVTKEDWESKKINYHQFNANDHELVKFDTLLEAGQEIVDAVKNGKTSYVHCRAGHGRSSMGIGAGLIMLGIPLEVVVYIIKTSRPSATIHKKLDGGRWIKSI